MINISYIYLIDPKENWHESIMLIINFKNPQLLHWFHVHWYWNVSFQPDVLQYNLPILRSQSSDVQSCLRKHTKPERVKHIQTIGLVLSFPSSSLYRSLSSSVPSQLIALSADDRRYSPLIPLHYATMWNLTEARFLASKNNISNVHDP